MEKRFAEWLTNEQKTASKWQIIRPTAMKTTMPHLEQQPDGSLKITGCSLRKAGQAA